MFRRFLAFALLAGASAVFGESVRGTPPGEGQGRSLEHLKGVLLGETAAAADELVSAAAERERRLAGLAETEPADVLRQALPPHVRPTLPSPVRRHVEEQVEMAGTLQVLIEDRDDGSRQWNVLESDSGERYTLHFASAPVRLFTGERVRVRGLRVHRSIVVESGSADIGPLSLQQDAMLALAGRFGDQRTAVILVNFVGNPVQPQPVSLVRSVVFNDVNNFDLENSYQQMWLTGDVFGWYTIPAPTVSCDPWVLANQARAAATQAGVNLSNYSRHVISFPTQSCFPWYGLGTVGGDPSTAWINGPMGLSVVAHEMGHNLGLYHSHALDCGAAVLGPGCSSIEYGDQLDTMGMGNGAHFNAFQKERLGWLGYGTSPPIKTVTSSGTYAIDPFETLGSAPKALKIPRGTTSSYYYVELRRPIGFDSYPVWNPNVLSGVVIHLAEPSIADSSDLLDMTPWTSSWGDPALTVGQTFTDPDYALSITTNSVSATGASMTVTLTGPPPPPPPSCTHVSPAATVAASPAGSVSAGTKVTYTVSVTNRDVSPCTVSTFSLGASGPSGWTLAWGATSLSIGPGATASTTLQVTSPASAASGTYAINGIATNSGATSASAPFSATYVVSSTPGGGGGGAGGTFSDTFSRADSTSLGTAWSEVSGDLVVSGNMLKNAPAVGNHMAVVSALTGPTQTVSADFTSTDNNLGPRFGIVLRYQDPKNYYLIYRQVGGSSRLLISRVVNGVEKILANMSIGNPARNVPFRLTGRVTGTTLSLDFGGVNRVNITDTTFSTGKVGVLIGSYSKTTQYQADNFTASVK